MIRGVTIAAAPNSRFGQRTINALRAAEQSDLRSLGSPYESGEALAAQHRIWTTAGSSAEGSHSSAVLAADAEGNVVAMTHTINTITWGTTGIFVDGVSISDPAKLYASRADAAGPGGRISTDSNPMMVLDDNLQPKLAMTTIGSGLAEITFVRLSDAVEYGQHLLDSFLQPSFHFANQVEANQYDPVVLNTARAMGAPFVELPARAMALRGYIIGVQIDRDTGMMHGGFNERGMHGSVEAISQSPYEVPSEPEDEGGDSALDDVNHLVRP